MEIIGLILLAGCLLYLVIKAAWFVIAVLGALSILYFIVDWLIQKIKKIVKK